MNEAQTRVEHIVEAKTRFGEFIVHAATAAKASWLVTGDRDLLDVPPMSRLRLLSPAAALKLPEFQV